MCSGQCSPVRSGALFRPHPIRLLAWRPQAWESARQDLYPNLSEPLGVRLPEQPSQRKQQSALGSLRRSNAIEQKLLRSATIPKAPLKCAEDAFLILVSLEIRTRPGFTLRAKSELRDVQTGW